MLRTAPPIDCTIWNTMIPANSTGPRIAETQNHLVRTRSTNSRRMTAQTLCTGSVLASAARCGGRGLRAHEVYEDLVKGWTRELKAREPRSGTDERLEDLLRVGPRREFELRLLAEVLDLRHEPPVREDLLRAALAAVERDDDVFAAVRALHLRQRAVDELPAACDDAQPVAQLLRVLHDVRREQHGLTTPPIVLDGGAQDLCAHGIEACER